VLDEKTSSFPSGWHLRVTDKVNILLEYYAQTMSIPLLAGLSPAWQGANNGCYAGKVTRGCKDTPAAYSCMT